MDQKTGADQAQQELFDLIIIDEASQMDVPHAILPLAALSEEGSVALAGDPKQLPPIHQAEAPVGLEHLVGSVYEFAESQQGIAPVMLNVNYRSNSSLVNFSLRAGYQSSLVAFSPDLKLQFVRPLPVTQPLTWPRHLFWTAHWSSILDPDKPAVCFVYNEGRSSQWNNFEADCVTALITTLSGHLSDRLENEIDPASQLVKPTSTVAYSTEAFWEQGIGIVTPHRAQQGLIISRLEQVFCGQGVSPGHIRNAVDTVERFQGQQRDVIIATFALGDPDAIQTEDEFLLSLNRFNVLSSRARAKLVVLLTQELVDHLSSDLDTLRESRLLKTFVESYCSQAQQMRLSYIDHGVTKSVDGLFKWAP